MIERGFVAGATGLTGRGVVRHLLARGAEAIAHVRPDARELAAQRAAFEALGARVDTTPWDEAAMTETLRRLAPSAVFALLGTTRKRAKAEGARDAAAAYEAIDYGLTALLRRAAEASGVRPRFVYVSMVGLDRSRDSKNPYTQVRVRIERELVAGALPYTIVRPSLIIGDRDDARAGESLAAGALDGALGLVGALGGRRVRDRYRSITGDALGAACVRLAFDADAQNRVFEPDALRA